MFRSSTLLALAFAVSAFPLTSHAQTNATTGAVFVMTNNASSNQVIAYTRNADGTLTGRHSFATGGRGSGGLTDPLASQGSLTLTQDHSYLLAVNAGSGDISVFQVSGATLTLLGTTPCGGSEPVAVASQGHLVYVVNAGGTSNVSGFHLTSTGALKPIPHSTTFLTTGNSGAASLAFSPDGQTLLVTEKLTGNIDGFSIQANGTLGPIVVNPSAGPGLFGVVFAPNGTRHHHRNRTERRNQRLRGFFVREFQRHALCDQRQRSYSRGRNLLARGHSQRKIRLHVESGNRHDLRLLHRFNRNVDSGGRNDPGNPPDWKREPRHRDLCRWEVSLHDRFRKRLGQRVRRQC